MLKPRRPNNLIKIKNTTYCHPIYQDGFNTKHIVETHPFIPLRKAISISFFNLSTNLGRNNGIDESFEIKSIKQIKEDYRKSILSYYNIFPEIKNFPNIDKLEKQIDKWISDVKKHSKETKETDRMFVSFLKNEILNDKKLSYEENDCENIIGPAYILLTEIFNQTYDSLKKLSAIKYYESLKGSIQNFKDLR